MKRFIDGTSDFTSGLPRTTWKNPSLQVRLIGFALAVAAVAFLIVGIDSNIWRAQGHLEEGFSAIKAEKFYFGVNFRVSLRKLNDSLLDYYLTSNPADLDKFRQEARELKTWLQAKQPVFTAQGEEDAFKKLKAAYGDFLARVESQVQR